MMMRMKEMWILAQMWIVVTHMDSSNTDMDTRSTHVDTRSTDMDTRYGY